MHAQLSIITPNSNETKLTRDPRNGTASTSTPKQHPAAHAQFRQV